MATKILYEEKELLIHASNGSEEAFSLIFHTYKNKLYGYLFRITESSEVAEDIVQEIFLKLWKDKSDLANIISFDSYLFRMAKNYAINSFKSRARQALLYVEYLETQTEEDYSTDHKIQFEETQYLLQQIVDTLPPQQKLVYQLSREQYLKHDEIAEMLNISPLTVKNHIIQALNTIKKSLKYQAVLMMALAFWYQLKK